LWHDEVRAVLCPQRAVLVRIARGLRPRVAATQVLRCEPAGAPEWKAAVELLAQALTNPPWNKAAALTLIVSNHFVRYLLVPWSAELTAADEERAWVSRHFSDVYGDTGAPHEYRWSADIPDGPCLASAIDGGLLAAVRSAITDSPLRLRSIQPYFMSVFNSWRRSIGKTRQWLVLGEPGHVCIGALERGRWQSFRARKFEADWQDEIPTILERERLLAEPAGEGEVLVHFAGVPEAELARLAQPPARVLNLPPIPGYSSGSEPDCAMAISGAA
jgi:hypothetical protein